MNEYKKMELTEDHLEHLSGGGLKGVGSDEPKPKTCEFIHAGGKTSVRQRPDGRYESQCGGTCWTLKNACPCKDTPNCVERWHIVTVNGSPLPNNNEHSHWYG